LAITTRKSDRDDLRVSFAPDLRFLKKIRLKTEQLPVRAELPIHLLVERTSALAVRLAAIGKILLGKEDLPKSETAPVSKRDQEWLLQAYGLQATITPGFNAFFRSCRFESIDPGRIPLRPD